MKSIIETLDEIKLIYHSRGFKIENIHGDNEFNKNDIKNSQLPALFHIYGKNDHVVHDLTPRVEHKSILWAGKPL